MTGKEYQELAIRTCSIPYDQKEDRLFHAVFGLNSEAGEVAGCEHHCKGCQNPVTWNPDDGLVFDKRAFNEIMKALEKSYVAGITFSGGDPLHPQNRGAVFSIMKAVQKRFPKKTIWVYTGYTWEQILANKYLLAAVKYADVLVDGRFEEELKDVNYHWAGSTNQRVIDVQKSLQKGEVVLHESN